MWLSLLSHCWVAVWEQQLEQCRVSSGHAAVRQSLLPQAWNNANVIIQLLVLELVFSTEIRAMLHQLGQHQLKDLSVKKHKDCLF